MDKYNIEEIREKLERCRNIPLSEINPDEVDDLKNIKISRKKSKEERILDFIITTKNPYVFKVNGRLVKIEFSNNERRAEDAIMSIIKGLYK